MYWVMVVIIFMMFESAKCKNIVHNCALLQRKKSQFAFIDIFADILMTWLEWDIVN